MKKVLIGLLALSAISGGIGLILLKILQKQMKEDEVLSELEKEFGEPPLKKEREEMREIGQKICEYKPMWMRLEEQLKQSENPADDLDMDQLNVELKFDEDGFLIE